MAFDGFFPRFRPAAAVLWLAGAALAQAAWIPLHKEIRNESSSAVWIVDFFDAPTARMGYAMAHGAAVPAAPVQECRGKVVLPPGSRLCFHSELIMGGTLRFQLRDQAATQGALLGILDVGKLGPETAFSEERRFQGTAAPRQAVLVGSGQITIRDLEAAAPAHREVKAESKGSARTLPALSDDDRAAGVYSVYYTTGKIRYQDDWGSEHGWAEALHGRGNQLSQASLLDMFFNTMFQYYTCKLVNYDATLNYDQYPTLAARYFGDDYKTWLARFCEPRGVPLVPVPAPEGDFSEFQKYREALATARAALMANPRFCALATAYMRQKVVCEKLVAVAQGKISRGESPKTVNALSASRSVLTNDIQVMIYNWMDQAYGVFVHAYSTAAEAGKPDAGTALLAFQPDFLRDPFYADIMNHLGEYQAPVTALEGVSLP